jgi:hypothetical protein
MADLDKERMALELRKDGLSCRRISEIIGISKSSVNRILKDKFGDNFSEEAEEAPETFKLQRTIRKDMNVPLINHMDIPTSDSFNPIHESSMPYGNEELVNKTKDFQPRTRINNSRELQFRSHAERIEYYKRAMHTVSIGKTYIPESVKQDGYYYKWIRMALRDKPDTQNMKRHECHGWEWVRAEEAPELAFLDYNGEIRDSVGIVEGGGLGLGKLDNELHAEEEAIKSKTRNIQNRFKEVLTRMPGKENFGFNSTTGQDRNYIGNPGYKHMV